jgi:hypothetical protein
MFPADIFTMPRRSRFHRLVMPKVSKLHGLRASTSPAARVGEHDLGMAVEGGNEFLQPARMPQVMIAGKGEILGAGILLARHLERPPRVVHEAEPLGVLHVGHARVERFVPARDLRRRIGRAVVHQHQREIGERLREERLDGLGKVLRVVEER